MSSPTKEASTGQSATLPLRASGRLRKLGDWLRQTFAGLTAGRLAVFCLVMLVFAMCRPSIFMAVWTGKPLAGIAGVAVTPLVIAFCRFTPVLLLVVAAANRAPRTPWAQAGWLAAALVVGQAIGAIAAHVALARIAPDGYLAKMLDLQAPASVQALRWFGASLGDLALCTVAVAFWYCLKHNSDAAAALDQAQQDREETQRENAEARLLVMQAQIEPHFLFNTLASIRRLYETDPASGRTMLRHLSSYLAASLPTLRATRSTLGRELALATAYLNVQKIRMGARLAVEIDVPASLHEIEMPPMMLATLAENAIIHGLGPLREGGRVRICARISDARLVVEVADDGRGLQDAWGVGVGIANIRARLHSQFGDAADVTLADGPQRGVTATIVLPVHAPAQAEAA